MVDATPISSSVELAGSGSGAGAGAGAGRCANDGAAGACATKGDALGPLPCGIVGNPKDAASIAMVRAASTSPPCCPWPESIVSPSSRAAIIPPPIEAGSMEAMPPIIVLAN